MRVFEVAKSTQILGHLVHIVLVIQAQQNSYVASFDYVSWLVVNPGPVQRSPFHIHR